MNVSLDDAYAEACKALGEATIRERLLVAELDRLTGLLTAAHQGAELDTTDTDVA